MGKLLNYLPNKFSIKWLWLYLVKAFILSALLVVGNIFILDVEFGLPLIKPMVIISAILTFVPSLFGFLHAKVVYVITSLGIAGGLCAVMYHYMYTTNEPGFRGMSALFGYCLGGFVLGLLLQIVWFFIKRRR